MLKILRNASIFIGVILFMFFMGIASLMRPDIPVERLLDTYTYPNSHFLDFDGMQIHYTSEGDGEPLLLIHGTFASLHTWDDWTSKLQGDFRVIRLDLPGFGLTGPQPDNDYSTKATLYLLEALRRELDIERWSIAGNSLGGGIALAYARHFPDQTHKLILLNAAAGRLPESASAQIPDSIQASHPEQAPDSTQVPSPEQAPDSTQVPSPERAPDSTQVPSPERAPDSTQVPSPERAPATTQASESTIPQQRPLALRALDNPRIRNILTVLTPRAVIQQSLKEVYADENRIRTEVVQRYFDLLRREGNRKAFLSRNAGPTADRSHIPDLPMPVDLNMLPHPVLIMWGEQDRWIRVHLGRRLHDAMPGSELIVYPDAGHVPMEEIPDETVRDAMIFLKK
jgi:pimeloyl-ACP methyl ester carboxylesterase